MLLGSNSTKKCSDSKIPIQLFWIFNSCCNNHRILDAMLTKKHNLWYCWNQGIFSTVFSLFQGGFYLDDLWCALYLLPRKLFSPNRFLTSLSQTVSCGSFSQKPAKIPSTLLGGSIDVVSSTMTFQKVIESKRYNNPLPNFQWSLRKVKEDLTNQPLSKYSEGTPPPFELVSNMSSLEQLNTPVGPVGDFLDSRN